ncbi:hypothetical protein Syun_029366 [Stephania yunnanensis]|uniref:Reverse transcriptase Ty1/copia-type domain-containing protein n=1 Tax=Stephania yunnanensis TaxID=152371 RepID=A0AAP0HLA9_9MAGN
MIENGFKINECDKCVYIKEMKSSCIVCLYVDDMLIIGTNKDIIISTKKMLSSNFDMKDLGQTVVILGIQIKRNDYEYILSKSYYVKKILKRFNQFNYKPTPTPFERIANLRKILKGSFLNWSTPK